jgi:hypothetical protein
MAISVGGTARPGNRPVSALITSSNFEDCTTGRSAGLAPLRIHWETENPHCFCSISICFVIRMAFCA